MKFNGIPTASILVRLLRVACLVMLGFTAPARACCLGETAQAPACCERHANAERKAPLAPSPQCSCAQGDQELLSPTSIPLVWNLLPPSEAEPLRVSPLGQLSSAPRIASYSPTGPPPRLKTCLWRC
jgi:hypothetical protein